MRISDAAIRNPVFAWMLMVSLMLFGWLSFSRMGISLMPDVDFPVVSVNLSWPGAAPEIMESQVVDLVEDAVTAVQGVREISSTSRHGAAVVTVEFELDRDIDAALQEIQTRLTELQNRLPRDMDPPVINKVNPEDNPIMWVALSGDRPLKDIMVLAKDVLKQRFQTVPGVGEVFLGGLLERNLRVWLDAQRMAAKDVTVEDVLAAIHRQHAEVPGGHIETPVKEYNVRTLGEFPSVEAFGDLLITHRGGESIHVPIKLREIARIEDGLSDFRRISRVMGERAVGMGIRKQRGANAVAVARGVRARMEELRKGLPPGLKLGINFDSTRFIEDAVHELNFNLIVSSVLTALVCWAFLGSWSSTLNVLLAIPTSILGTFIVAYFLGFTLNTFSLLGLTLAIGIVVDDAIMVLENIVRHMEKGRDRMAASVYGAREISFAALAATVAILAIFVPVVFMKGIVGKFFFQFGVTMSAAVMLSLLEALTLAPMRCSRFLEAGDRANPVSRAIDRAFSAGARGYRAALELCLRHRWKVVLLSILFFAGSLLPVRRIRKEFVPSQDQSIFMVRMQTPVGSSMEFTDSRFRQAEAWLQSLPYINRYFAAIGGFGGGEVNSGILFVTLKPPAERPRGPDGRAVTQQRAMAEARAALNKIPDLKAFVIDLSQGGFSAQRGGSFPIDFTVRGPDWDTLTRVSQDLLARIEKTPDVTDVDTDFKTGMPEVRVFPDRERAYARGVSIDTIGTAINAMIGGVRAGYFTDQGRRYEVRVRAESRDRLQPADISKLLVRNARGEPIRLSEVVKVEERPTLLYVSRRDRERAIGIFANVAPGRSQEDALAAVERAAREVLPEGYRMVFSGTAKTFREARESLVFALVLGLIVAYMVLGAQFNSFVHPFTVLLALPFSASGAFLAMWAWGVSLNMYSMIGLVLLMGIVKKNSILLVDFTNQRRREGLSVGEALLDACPVRLRPILMTSISTIAAAVPPAMAWGPGAEARIPMAVAVIGGVAVATFLTLFVVPCAYSLLSRIERAQPSTEFDRRFGGAAEPALDKSQGG